MVNSDVDRNKKQVAWLENSIPSPEGTSALVEDEILFLKLQLDLIVTVQETSDRQVRVEVKL